jgi:lipopolysaccharide export system protein LptC
MRERAGRSLLDRATAWSPVLLLGGLAALTYWLDAQVQPPLPRRDGTERHDPDIYVEGFRAVELDAAGRARQLIAGKRALHYGDDQTTEIVEP